MYSRFTLPVSLLAAALFTAFVSTTPVFSQNAKKFGGAKPSLGKVGGSGARPAMPSGFGGRPNSLPGSGARPNPTRPSFGNAGAHANAQRPGQLPNIQRPNVQRPNVQTPNVQRPNVQRPNLQTPPVQRPNVQTPNRPNIQVPSVPRPDVQRPGTQPRPGVQRPDLQRPGLTRPTPLPGGSRPSLGGPGTKPSIDRPSTRPGIPGAGQPGAGQRPGTRPGTDDRLTLKPPTVRPPIQRPDFTTRPVPKPGAVRPPQVGQRPLPGVVPPRPSKPSKPSFGNVRPAPEFPKVTLKPPVTRPYPEHNHRPGYRPGQGNHPGQHHRPPSWGNHHRPSHHWHGHPNTIHRPTIGGVRPAYPQTHIHIGNLHYWNRNRPSWDFDPGFSRPSWGIGSSWHHHWHHHCVHNHHRWYNGCWTGYWNSSWYAPITWGATGWGLGSLTSNWRYGTTYYNPYYVTPMVAQPIAYDYSRPVQINQYVTTPPQDGTPTERDVSPAEQQGLSKFDEGLASFKSGNYVQALSSFNEALKQLPNDVVVHEVRAVALFAVGDYKSAAASLNSLLASAPGMDWTSMSGLYGNPDDYTSQLRKLENHARQSPDDAASHFVLAYHYLVLGSKEEAIDSLRVVVAQQPRDGTATRMLEALASPEPADEPEAIPSVIADADPTLQTDLVGNWAAQSGDTRIELLVTEDSQFTWKVLIPGQEAIELKGNMSGDSEGIELITDDQGTLGGTVVSQGPDRWVFILTGSPASDPGLSFNRVR